MVDGVGFNEQTFVLLDVGKGPYAVVSGDGVVAEVHEGLGADVAAKDGVGHIFEIVLFVVLLVGVDLWVGEVEVEVEELLIIVEVLDDFFLGGAGSGGVRLIFAG